MRSSFSLCRKTESLWAVMTSWNFICDTRASEKCVWTYLGRARMRLFRGCGCPRSAFDYREASEILIQFPPEKALNQISSEGKNPRNSIKHSFKPKRVQELLTLLLLGSTHPSQGCFHLSNLYYSRWLINRSFDERTTTMMRQKSEKQKLRSLRYHWRAPRVRFDSIFIEFVRRKKKWDSREHTNPIDRRAWLCSICVASLLGPESYGTALINRNYFNKLNGCESSEGGGGGQKDTRWGRQR